MALPPGGKIGGRLPPESEEQGNKCSVRKSGALETSEGRSVCPATRRPFPEGCTIGVIISYVNCVLCGPSWRQRSRPQLHVDLLVPGSTTISSQKDSHKISQRDGQKRGQNRKSSGEGSVHYVGTGRRWLHRIPATFAIYVPWPPHLSGLKNHSVIRGEKN